MAQMMIWVFEGIYGFDIRFMKFKIYRNESGFDLIWDVMNFFIDF